jgi:hypothetical protein
VAFARVDFSNAEVSRWQMISTAVPIPKLKEGEIFGFGVDSGTAAFMDAIVLEHFKSLNSEEYEAWQDAMFKELDATYVHTWSHGEVAIAGGNIIAFSSGYGDGVYATYLGIDSEDAPVTLVTDFATFEAAA